MENFVRTVKDNKNVAERCVKIISDYSKILTKDINLRRKLLQGVETSRKIHPRLQEDDPKQEHLLVALQVLKTTHYTVHCMLSFPGFVQVCWFPVSLPGSETVLVKFSKRHGRSKLPLKPCNKKWPIIIDIRLFPFLIIPLV